MQRSPRDRAIRSGAILLGLGFLASFGTVLLAGELLVIAWGPMLVGLLQLVRGFAMPRALPPSAEWVEQMEGRDGPDDPRPQVAGQRCVHCVTKIISSLDGAACAVCNQPVHDACRKDHRGREHAPPKEARPPYR
jgi:hypothetical protein